VSAGNPRRAAEFAFRDASVSHIKNGIYGAMWVAAMVASALVEDEVRTAIEAGMAEIPAKSRLHLALSRVLAEFDSGVPASAAVDGVHSRWNEACEHDWCHTISNAEIVALSLLHGKGEFGESICLAVSSGFDTDCNGATTGSVLGALRGASAIPREWTEPLNDTLLTGVAGFHRVRISKMAERTLCQMKER
jgi:ADP-ribosylglycohydrolase